MPFNRLVGSAIDYKAAKPTNWKDGDYKKWTGEPDEKDPGKRNILTLTSYFLITTKNVTFFCDYSNCESCISQSVQYAYWHLF